MDSKSYIINLVRDGTGRVQAINLFETEGLNFDFGEMTYIRTLEGQDAYEFYKSLEGDMKQWMT